MTDDEAKPLCARCGDRRSVLAEPSEVRNGGHSPEDHFKWCPDCGPRPTDKFDETGKPL